MRSRTRYRALRLALTRIGPARRWRSFFCAMVSTFTLNIFLSGELGDWDQVNTPGLITFGEFNPDPYHLWELFVFAAIGVAGGSVPPRSPPPLLVPRPLKLPRYSLLGALFNGINLVISKFRRAHINTRPLLRLVEAVLIALLCAAVAFLLPSVRC